MRFTMRMLQWITIVSLLQEIGPTDCNECPGEGQGKGPVKGEAGLDLNSVLVCVLVRPQLVSTKRSEGNQNSLGNFSLLSLFSFHCWVRTELGEVHCLGLAVHKKHLPDQATSNM